MATSHLPSIPPKSPPRGQRSISYEHPSSPRGPSSSRPLPPPLYMDASTDPTDPSSSAHASSSCHSSLATRTRSRSVGSKARAEEVFGPENSPAAQAAVAIGEHLDRGPGTPDFVLGDSLNRHKGTKAKGRIGEIIRSAEDGPSHPPASQGASADGATRPRLTSRLRSFFTSFSAAEPHLLAPPATSAKARTSSEFRHPLHPSARSKSAADSNAIIRPQGLVIPAARPAAFGEFGLNDDSPPLTPLSDEEREYLRSQQQNQRRQWNADLGSSASSADNLSSASDPTSATSLSDSDAVLTAGCKPAISLGTGGVLASRLTPTHGESLSRPLSRLSLNDIGERIQAGLRSKSLRQHMPTLLMLLTFFVFSTLVVFILLTTLPLRFPSHGLTQLSLAEIRDICMSLREYATSTPQAYHHTLMALCLFFTYLQAFNVPGSIICNVVFGALFGAWRATFWLSIFTAVGGSGAAVMSALVAPLVLKIPGMAKAVEVMRRALGNSNAGGNKRSAHPDSLPLRKRSPMSPNSRSATPRLRATSPHPSGKNKAQAQGSKKSTGGNLFSVLLLLRLLPLTPYGMMNIACGILNVPLVPFASTLAVGSVPWNAVTAQLGEILLDVVAAFPVEGDDELSEADLAMGTSAAGLSMGDQLDSGGFHNVPRPGSEAMRNVIAAEKTKLSSAAHKAGGGIKILLAKIWTREMILKLVGLSLLSITPVLLGRWWKARQARQSAAASKARKARIAAEREREREQPQHGHAVAAPSAFQPNPVAAAVLNWSDGEHDDESSSYSGSYTRYDSGPDYDEEDEGDDDDDDSTYEYDVDEDDDADETVGRRGSKMGFAAMAESTPAFIANLTRSASRNSWNSNWFKSAQNAASQRTGSPMTLGGTHSAWPGSEQQQPGVTTPQLELAHNPFEAAPKPYSQSPSPVSAWSSQPHSRSPSKQSASSFRPSFFDPNGSSNRESPSPSGGIDFSVHPAVGANAGVGHVGLATGGHHSRQTSAAGTLAEHGVKREPKRLHATLNASS